MSYYIYNAVKGSTFQKGGPYKFQFKPVTFCFNGINKISNSLAYENYASATHKCSSIFYTQQMHKKTQHHSSLRTFRLKLLHTYNASLFAGGMVYHGWQQKLGTKVMQHLYIMSNMKRKIQQIWLFLEKTTTTAEFYFLDKNFYFSISIETILSVQFASHYIKSHLNLMSNSCHGIVTP